MQCHNNKFKLSVMWQTFVGTKRNILQKRRWWCCCWERPRGVGQRAHEAPSVGRDKRPLDFVAFHTLRKTFVSRCVCTFCIILCSLPYFEFYCGHLTTPQGMPVSVGTLTLHWRIHKSFQIWYLAAKKAHSVNLEDFSSIGMVHHHC